MKNKYLLLLFALCPALLFSQTKESLPSRLEAAGMVPLKDIDPSIRVDLCFSQADNVAGRVLYADLHDAYLHPQAALALRKSQAALKRLRPDLTLLIYDAARPISTQQQLHNLVKGKNTNIYINDPKFGGDQHNYGLAVDVTLCKENGDTLSMGTRHGALCELSGQGHEETALAEGKLTQEQVANRQLLRRVMAIGGYKPLRTQWWHFNFRTISEAKANFKKIP
ncbi:MAG: D-alanyl-D-alanine dipeptidase [Alloprevotella sp.]|nr:D-alanyl-D-alanine dipeptidase [Alloprevotella sp.]